jgi:hypothetical protein
VVAGLRAKSVLQIERYTTEDTEDTEEQSRFR